MLPFLSATAPPETERTTKPFVFICFDTPPVVTSSTDGDGIDSRTARAMECIHFNSGSVFEQRTIRHRLGKGQTVLRVFAGGSLMETVDTSARESEAFASMKPLFFKRDDDA